MSDFLDLVESLTAEEASIGRLFNGEGVGVRHANLREAKNYQRAFTNAVEFVADVASGKRPVYHLQEAMTTDDFPLLFGDVLDRTVLAGYRETPTPYDARIAPVRRVRDFRPIYRYALDGAEGNLDEVKELTEYPQKAMAASRFSWSIKKYGRAIAHSWEMGLADDLNFFTDIPARLGRAARRTQSRFITGLLFDANGPHASFFTGGNNNIIAANAGLGTPINPPLSLVGIQAGLTQLSTFRDTDGEPIAIDMVHLVVPPALMVVAQNILNSLQVETNIAALGGSLTGLVNSSGLETRLIVQNWLRNKITLHVDPYIPITVTNANRGNTSWLLMADATDSRPAIELGALVGHEEPEIFVKEPNARRVGGGAINPLDGDFDVDGIAYKVRYVTGGGRIDPKAALGSNGTGV